MSPAKVVTHIEQPFPEPDLHIMGIGAQYPEHVFNAQDFKEYVLRHYPMTPAIGKVLMVNDNTGIDTRYSACPLKDSFMDGPTAPTIDQLGRFFLDEGVKLAVGASRKAIEEWGGDISQITHVVATTCTNSANPGYDYFVSRELGLSGSVERVLLHGVGCAGGLAALRTAANLALGATCLKKPARILVVTCELSSLMARSELDSVMEDNELRIGVTIFGDGSSALVLSNGIGEEESKPVFDLLGWEHRTVPETEGDIGFDVHPNGWKVILSARVPVLSSAGAPQVFSSLVPRIPSVVPASGQPTPADFDWALHPGGIKVITSCQKVLGLTAEHLRASYEVYKTHGNSSSATIFSVMNRLRLMGEGRDNVIACAFGPGVAIEMAVLRRVRDAPVHADVSTVSAGSSDSE